MKTKKVVRRRSKSDEEISPVRITMEKPGSVLPMYRCRFCNHEWVPRQNTPAECPNCKRRGWYESKVKSSPQDADFD